MQQAEDVLRREFTNESVKEAAGILYSVGITPKEAVAFIERRKPQLVAAVDPAFQDYNNYLTAIFRPTDTLCFVGIVHNSDKGKEHVANDFVPFEKAVTREYYDHLKDENSAGSIYVATNTFPSSLIGLKAGRTQENVVEVRAVQADVDYNGAATIEAIKTSAAVPQPSIIVESSPGKFQGIWLVDGISKQDAKPLMQGIAATFQTDSAVAEVARVMRVPGFVNRKYESAPVAKTLLQTNQRYRREQFKVAIPESKFETKAENWVNDVVVTHGNAYNDLLSLAGYYVRQKNINDSEMLYKLLAGHCENAVDRDGKTPWQPDLEQVRVYAEKWAAEFETKESYDSRTKLALTQQPTPGSPAAQAAAPAIDVSDWRSLFRSIGEMEDGPIDMIIEGALQEGTCFLGATAGDGKTLVALAFAKAISTGTALFDLPQFGVKIPRPVIYLIPESRDRAFRKRCEAFKLPDDKTKFMTRTISAGRPLELSDPRLVEAVRQTKAVVFLDTASRFMKGTDENSATQNQLLVNDVITLLAAGAVCVVLLHHANKSSKQNKESMTLENMLRGTSDFAAMCDQAYGIRKDMTVYAHGSGPMEIELVSLKDREQIGGLTSIRLAASYKVKITAEGRFESQYPKSWITETGNFRVMSDMETGRRESQNIENAVKADPNIPAKDIALALGISEYRVKSTLEHLKYHRVKGGPGGASPWHQDVGGVCPYDKVVEVKPSKKKLDSTVTEVVAELGKLLATTNVDADETIPETQVLSWADGKGITDVVLNKARRRLGVVLGRDGNIKTWSLPAAATPPAEPAASQQADVPEAF
jgi:hypothetical protein